MKKIGNNFYFLLFVFLLVNIVQSIFTPISKDEAYYWMYSQNLDWGFFDHPPMIALIIKLGTLFFNGTLGVRILTNLIMTFTLVIIWKLIPEDDRKKENSVLLFFLLAFSIPVFNIYGFITTPDVPLLFFSALYLYVFLGFIAHNCFLNALKLGVVAALLMYSKYHGAFLILFSLIPHYKLLWNRYFYLAGLIGIGLFLPHLYWQFEHDFISFRYHLFQRTDGFMKGKHIAEFVMNAFIIFNPFLFGLFLYHSRKKDQNEVPKVFPFVIWGFLVFFAFTSLRDHIEPQWIGVGAIPLLIMLVHYFVGSKAISKILLSITVGSIVLIFIMRLGLMLPLPVSTEFHEHKLSYFETIKEKAQGSKTVFVNTYYDAAKYTFYTGAPAFSYNCYDYRKNQYDIWDCEEIYHNNKVFLLSGYPYPWVDSSFDVEGQKFYYEHFPSFPMINKTTARILSIHHELQKNRIQSIEFIVYNPYEYPLVFNSQEIPLFFDLVFQVGKKRYVVPLRTDEVDELGPGSEKEFKGYFYPRIPAGDYQVAVGLRPGMLSSVLITEKFGLKVK